MSDPKNNISKERADNIKKKERDRLNKDIYSIKVNQHRYPSESEYVRAIKECRNAYNETIKAITEIEKEADNNQAYLSTREITEIFLILLELAVKAPSASFRCWYAKKIVDQLPKSIRLAELESPPLTGQNKPLQEILTEAIDRLKPKQIPTIEDLAKSLGDGFQQLEPADKIAKLTEQLGKRKITGSWKGYVIPNWLNKGLLIAAISVALWETVETPEQERVVKIAREAVILSTAYVTAQTVGKASEKLLVMVTAIAPESEGLSLVVYTGLYIVATIVATLVGEGVAELFDSIFGSNTQPVLTKELIKSLEKDLVKDLVKDLCKKLEKEL